MSYLSATVLLPRRDVIVRQLALPGVAAKDMEGAIRLQLDSLHPYGEDEISWGWSPLAYGAVLVGIARRIVGRPLRGAVHRSRHRGGQFHVSAAAVHAAIRLNGPAGATGSWRLSRVGDRARWRYTAKAHWRPVFSAEFEPGSGARRAAGAGRVAAAARNGAAVAGTGAAQAGRQSGGERSFPQRTAVRHGAGRGLSLAVAGGERAAAGASPLQFARGISCRPWCWRRWRCWWRAPCGSMRKYAERQYLEQLQAEIARVQPRAQRAVALDRETAHLRARTAMLDLSRPRAPGSGRAQRADATGAPPAWTSNIDMTRERLRITGEAPQAAPLLKILDSSPLFQNSGFDMAQRSQSGQGEVFQIHSSRRVEP